MKNKDNITNPDKEKLEAIIKLLSPRKRKYYKIDEEELSSQEVTFMVENNDELRYIISCLLRVRQDVRLYHNRILLPFHSELVGSETGKEKRHLNQIIWK